MKKIMNVVTIVSILLTACTHDVTNPSDNNGNSSNSTVVNGNFTITKFTDSNPNEDKTANFTGYVFTFSNDGRITAVKNEVTLQGTYSEKPSHEGEAAKLTINFTDESLNDLNKSWQIELINDSAIHLSDDDNAAEVLEFTAQ
jgi:hypothetical protein